MGGDAPWDSASEGQIRVGEYSRPLLRIKNVVKDLRARGVTTIEPVIITEETVEFRAPEELEVDA